MLMANPDNRDFELFSSGQSLVLGQNKILNKVLGQNESILIEELSTEHLGICYSWIQKPVLGNRIFFGIVPNQTLLSSEVDHPRGVSMFVTTENTRKDVIYAIWDNFYPLMITKKFSEKYMAIASLKETEWRFHRGDPKCYLGCKPSRIL